MCKALDAAEERGKKSLLTEQVQKKLAKGQSIEQIAEDLLEEVEKVRELAEKITEE